MNTEINQSLLLVLHIAAKQLPLHLQYSRTKTNNDIRLGPGQTIDGQNDINLILLLTHLTDESISNRTAISKHCVNSYKIMEPDHIERYDRQIRLWGVHGQDKCSSSKICLINANALGVEILRGLCLAGIGSFTILDSHKLAPEDVGCSFLPHSCIGKSRGESAKQMLMDINDEICGEVYPLEVYLPHVAQPSTELETSDSLGHGLEFWKQFNCVIASGFLYIDQIIRLSKICWAINTPLILCKSIGFFATMRSQIREHLIVETHPDTMIPDFNLDRPFEDLNVYFNSIDLVSDESINKISDYPYVVIVHHYLKQWQQQNNLDDNAVPSTYSEKKALKKMIDEGLKEIQKRKQSLNPKDENEPIKPQALPFENFIEASKAVNTCLTSSSKLPDTVEKIFSHRKVTQTPVQNLSSFWLIIKAMKEFVLKKNGGRLPVSGYIPDMISSSEEYIRLQAIYSKKAREDVESVFNLMQNLIHSSNCSPGSSLFDETKLLCKNIRDLRLISTDLISEEYNYKTCNLTTDDNDDQLITIELCLRASDVFFSTYSRMPGCDHVEVDIGKFKDCVKKIVGNACNQLKSLDQCLYEVCRFGGAELHATSAFIGGCIAQEVIKLVTNQYVPVEDTLVYDAVTATTKSFRLREVFGRVQ